MTGIVADIGIGPISIPTPGDLVTALKNAVVDVADAMFTKIIEWIAGLLADAVSKVTDALVTLLRTIRPTLTPGGAIINAAPIQQSVLGLAVSLLMAFYLFRIIHGLITGQAGQNIRATLVDLPMVVVGTLFFGFLCYTLLSVVDAFSDPMIDGYAETLNDAVTALYSKDGLVKGGLFVLIFAVLYLAGAIFLCFELFVRSSLIYLVIMFAPLAIATRLWGPTRNYARRATETAVALIFSKLAIAVTLATGASLMQGAASDGGVVEMIQGSAILLLAAFMPFALMRVIPMMEGAVAAEGVARGMGTKAAVAGYGASRAANAVSSPVSSTASAIRARWDNRSSSSASNDSSGGGSLAAGSGGTASSSTANSGTTAGPPSSKSSAAESNNVTDSSKGSADAPSTKTRRTATTPDTTPSRRDTDPGAARSAPDMRTGTSGATNPAAPGTSPTRGADRDPIVADPTPTDAGRPPASTPRTVTGPSGNDTSPDRPRRNPARTQPREKP